jgi:hypothetical protein
MPESASVSHAQRRPHPDPQVGAPVPVPHLVHRSPAATVAELRALMADTPAPTGRPRRATDPPNPRSWNYRKQPVPFKHLVVRFIRSIRPGDPSARSSVWAQALLSPEEWSLFSEQAGFDRRHAIGVARVVLELTDNPLAARAALLHDIGKVDCRLGPVGRSAATLWRMLFPHLSERWSRAWWVESSEGPGRRTPRRVAERFACYWMHPWAGSDMLAQVGAHPDVAAWAIAHHHWFIAEDLPFAWEEALALWYADGD